MESIFDELNENSIAPQRFSLAISVSIIYIMLTYLAYINEKFADPICILFMILGTWIIIFLKKYLQNFKNPDTDYWAQRNIIINIGFIIALTIQYFSNQTFIPPILRIIGSGIFVLYTLIFVVLSLYFLIKFGITLQKIENDFIGLLRPLGNMYIYLLPIVGVLQIIVAFIKKTIGIYGIVLEIATNTLDAIPSIVVIVIFYRAMKYRQIRQIE